MKLSVPMLAALKKLARRRGKRCGSPLHYNTADALIGRGLAETDGRWDARYSITDAGHKELWDRAAECEQTLDEYLQAD